jgi:hypothetical protein
MSFQLIILVEGALTFIVIICFSFVTGFSNFSCKERPIGRGLTFVPSTISTYIRLITSRHLLFPISYSRIVMGSSYDEFTNAVPITVIETFILRWQLEVTFEEVRRHLGMETQRQWSDNAIDRTTSCILALYSIN